MKFGRLAFLLILLALIVNEDTHPISEKGGNRVCVLIYRANDLGPFLDSFFAKQMKENHIPGAVFVMVEDGKIVFMKGYGVSSLESGTPVIPKQTLFRVGSISKLVTATAIMQLAERGQLSLDEDVNHYLKPFKLENNFPQPVTLSHLLTHTAGFEERAIGMSVHQESELIPLGEYLARRMPHRVLPPGQVYSYSNHGMALAGYLVEVISGVPYAQYVNKNIFAPLQMQHSSFALPASSNADLATDYRYKNDRYIPTPRHYLNIPPTGGLATTAEDMAHFMIAHLQEGRYLNRRILKESTARNMHARHFTQDPRIAGTAYGFYERFQNHQRMLEHLGDVFRTSSLLMLIPDKSLGFFVSYTRMDSALRENLVNEFLNRLFPIGKELGAVHPSNDLRRFSGYYLYNRYSRTTLEKLVALFAQCRLTPQGSGMLKITYPFDPKTSLELIQVAPLLFKKMDTGTLVAFKEDHQGRISQFFDGTRVFDRLPWVGSLPFQLGLIAFFIFAFLSALLIRVKGLIRFVSALNLCFLFGMGISYWKFDEFDWVFGAPRVVVALLCLPLVSGLISVALPFLALMEGKKENGWRFYDLFMSGVAVAFIGFLHYWNLLGFRY